MFTWHYHILAHNRFFIGGFSKDVNNIDIFDDGNIDTENTIEGVEKSFAALKTNESTGSCHILRSTKKLF